MAILIACLDALFDEFDAIAPGRDHASDGWIGDAYHSSTSDHTPDEDSDALDHKDADSTNEVHAIDVDDQLRCDVSMEDCVQLILGRCRSGDERRLRYIIYERRIWSASDGWREDYYDGSNAHDQHAHFSASYETSHESDRGPWGLVEEFMALSSDDKKWIESTIKKYVGDVVPRWTDDGCAVPESDDNPTMTVGSALHYIGRQTAPDGALAAPAADPAGSDPAAQRVEG